MKNIDWARLFLSEAYSALQNPVFVIEDGRVILSEDTYSEIETGLIEANEGIELLQEHIAALENSPAMREYKRSNQRYFDGLDINTQAAVEEAIGLEETK